MSLLLFYSHSSTCTPLMVTATLNLERWTENSVVWSHASLFNDIHKMDTLHKPTSVVSQHPSPQRLCYAPAWNRSRGGPTHAKLHCLTKCDKKTTSAHVRASNHGIHLSFLPYDIYTLTRGDALAFPTTVEFWATCIWLSIKKKTKRNIMTPPPTNHHLLKKNKK